MDRLQTVLTRADDPSYVGPISGAQPSRQQSDYEMSAPSAPSGKVAFVDAESMPAMALPMDENGLPPGVMDGMVG